MPVFLLIGLAAGLASAVLFASAATGGAAGRLFLYFLAPLPCFLAGLGWGSASAAVAAASSSLATGLVLGAKSGVVLLLTQGLPVAVLCHLALLNRPMAAPAGSPAGAAPQLEWYPVGRLVAVATLIAGALAFTTVILLGSDLDDIRTFLREMMEKVFLKQLPGLRDRELSEPEIKALVEVALYALPAASALSWLAGFLLNLWLAGRITQASGRLTRPWPDLAAMTYPRGFGLGLGVALAITAFVSGYPALLASGFAGAFFLAYLLMGLAIIHYVTRGQTWRPFILWGLYVALFVLNTWAAIVIALLAVVEPLLPWRRRKPPEGY